jgi:hypothetical protein
LRWGAAFRALTLVVLVNTSAFAATLTLAWDPPVDAETIGYIIRYGTKPGSYTFQRDVGRVTSAAVGGLLDATTYCFVVVAYGRSGTFSYPSSEVCGTTPQGGVVTTGPLTILVKTSAELQKAIDAARAGDTILLQAGVTFVGNFVLPNKISASTAFITIRSSASDTQLPGAGVRMTPAYGAVLPKLQSPNSSPALATARAAHHYRLQFLEFRGNATGTGAVLALGDGSSAQNSLDDVPGNLVIDRVYIHGDALRGQQRGIALNSANTTIANSHISDIKLTTGSAQAIAGWNGPGPWMIANNYIESAGENILIGGAAPSIAGLVPANIVLRRNLLRKHLNWRTESWVVRDLLEIQTADQVSIDGNVFENLWASSQHPYAIVLQPVAFGTAWTTVTDVQFTNNTVRNVPSALFLGDGGSSLVPTLTPTSRLGNITVRNNFFDRMTVPDVSTSSSWLTTSGTSDVTVDHNTIVSGSYFGVSALAPAQRFAFTNNVILERGDAIRGTGTLPGLATIAKYYANGEFSGGVFIGSPAQQYPLNNFYPLTIDAVGFVNYLAGDYRLGLTSIYRNVGADGKVPGCDFTALAAAQR